MHVLRPVGLIRSEPVGEQANHRIRRIDMVLKNAAHRRQPEACTKRIDGGSHQAVKAELIECPEQRAPEKLSRDCMDTPAFRGPTVGEAANHGGLKVNRGDGYSQLLAGNKGAKAKPGGRDHGIRTLPFADHVVQRPNVGKNDPLRHAFIRFPRIQQAGIGEDRLCFLDRAEFHKLQPGPQYLLPEKSSGDDDRMMAAFLQCDSNLNHGIHIAGTAKRGKQNVQFSPRVQADAVLWSFDLKLRHFFSPRSFYVPRQISLVSFTDHAAVSADRLTGPFAPESTSPAGRGMTWPGCCRPIPEDRAVLPDTRQKPGSFLPGFPGAAPPPSRSRAI